MQTSDLAGGPGVVEPLPTVRAAGIFNPPPDLKHLREHVPVCPFRYPDGHVGWLVTSHELARSVLADRRFSMRPPRSPVDDPTKTAAEAEAMRNVPFPEGDGVLIGLDPPKHRRLRRMLAGHFSVQRVEGHRRRIERIVADRLDAMEAAGPPVDFVETVASVVPSQTICELLGVPASDRERFERPTMVMQSPESGGEEKAQGRLEFARYAREVIARKRGRLADDVLSCLLASGELSDAEVAGVAMQLFAAGHETTTNMLTLSTFLLLTEPAQWDALCANPSLIGTAVEELLRYLTIVQRGSFTRTATEDVEVGGVLIEAGQGVVVSLSAANRDPSRFEAPEQFDPSRETNGHLAFGHGIHMCLGQHLARLEIEVGLLGLTQRFPTLRLAVPVEEIPLNHRDHQLHGARRLPVTW